MVTVAGLRVPSRSVSLAKTSIGADAVAVAAVAVSSTAIGAMFCTAVRMKPSLRTFLLGSLGTPGLDDVVKLLRRQGSLPAYNLVEKSWLVGISPGIGLVYRRAGLHLQGGWQRSQRPPQVFRAVFQVGPQGQVNGMELWKLHNP